MFYRLICVWNTECARSAGFAQSIPAQLSCHHYEAINLSGIALLQRFRSYGAFSHLPVGIEFRKNNSAHSGFESV